MSGGVLSQAAFNYSYGNHFTESGKLKATIMAYQKRDGYVQGVSNTGNVVFPQEKVLYFSGPNVQLGGVATGASDIDNAKTLGITIPEIQKYK